MTQNTEAQRCIWYQWYAWVFGCLKDKVGKCPQARKGEFVEKEGYATIGFEAVADYDLWIWHNVLRFPGSLNDINICDRSILFQSILDGSRSMIDFHFKINRED